MRRFGRDRAKAPAVVLVAPTLRRARAAVRALGSRWGGSPLVAAPLSGFLAGHASSRILLCPPGRTVAGDLAFLRRVAERILWPVPDGDLRAVIAGLRGEHLPPLAAVAPPPKGSDRKRALLFEGIVTAERARAGLESAARDWIVEGPLAVRLPARQLRVFSRAGVRWFTLQPIRVAALLASPALARERHQWRHLLPSGTKTIVWKTEAKSARR